MLLGRRLQRLNTSTSVIAAWKRALGPAYFFGGRQHARGPRRVLARYGRMPLVREETERKEAVNAC